MNDFTITLDKDSDTTKGLKHLEAAYIEFILRVAKYNQSKASRMLAISRGCLRMKLKEYFGDTYL